jgi:hypothetical protein
MISEHKGARIVDTTTWLIIGGLALLIVVAALVMLNRSWGNFPDRAGMLPPAGPSAPGVSSPSASSSAPSWEAQLLDTAAQPSLATERPAEAGELVPITHQMIRRAAEQALERGAPAARYIVRSGDQVYFDFSRIEDPAQRQEAYELMRRFNAGEDIDLSAMIAMVNRIFRPRPWEIRDWRLEIKQSPSPISNL